MSSSRGRLLLLVALAAGAAAAALAVPWLITPFRSEAPWYESTGMFPRFALVLVAAGALGELARRGRTADAESEELDASHSRPLLALAVLGLFVAYALLVPVTGFLPATALFAAAGGLVVGLSARVALALAVPLAVALWLLFARGLQVAFGGWL